MVGAAVREEGGFLISDSGLQCCDEKIVFDACFALTVERGEWRQRM